MSRRILYVENDYGTVGGSARALASLIQHLDRNRYEPYATFAASSQSPLRQRLEDLGCRAVSLGRKPLSRPTDPYSATGGHRSRAARTASGLRRRMQQTLARDVRLSAPLARVIQRHGIELVHANNNLRVNRYVYWAAAACGVPVVAHQRFIFPPGRVDACHARLVRCVLCISKVVRDSLEPIAGVCDRRLVYDGVDVPIGPPAPPRFGDAPTIAAVGRLVAWKGQHTLIRAASLILRKHPRVRFVLVGGGDAKGSYESELLHLVNELGIEGQVQFLGHVDEIDRFYREQADIVVHCSVVAEPFGLVMAEAMAAGLPVVASDAGASREIVEDGSTGLLFPAGDAEALADALLRLLDDPEHARQLGRQGFVRVQARFDAKRTTHEVSQVYEEILDH